MTEIEIYDASFNVSSQNFRQNASQRQSGEIAFKLPNNKSGKSRINFQIPYQKKPELNVVISINKGSVLDCRHAIENFDNTGFTLHILNGDLVNEVSGVISWWSQPFNLI